MERRYLAGRSAGILPASIRRLEGGGPAGWKPALPSLYDLDIAATLRRSTRHRESPLNATQYVLSGLRPTGRIHLGNYFGAIRNWVRLQDSYHSFIFVADWHALTSDYADTSRVREITFEATADLLAAGIDPNRATLFVQS